MTSQRADFHWFRTSRTAVEGSAGSTTQTFLIFPWSSRSRRWRFCVAAEKTLGEVNASPDLWELINTTEALPRHLHVDGDWFRMWLMQRGGAEASSRLNPGFRLSWSVLFSIARHRRRRRGGWWRTDVGEAPEPLPGLEQITASVIRKEPPADKRPGRFLFFFGGERLNRVRLAYQWCRVSRGSRMGRRRLPESHNASHPPPPTPHPPPRSIQSRDNTRSCCSGLFVIWLAQLSPARTVSPRQQCTGFASGTTMIICAHRRTRSSGGSQNSSAALEGKKTPLSSYRAVRL